MLRMLGLSLAIAAAASGGALACSCIERLSAEEAIARADYVFEGRAIESPCGAVAEFPEEFSDLTRSCGQFRTTRFAVEQSWKGPAGAEMAIRHGLSSCGAVYQAGQTYLIVARRHEADQTIRAGACDQPYSRDGFREALDAYRARQAATDANGRP